MAQLGAGLVTIGGDNSYPNSIDTTQTWQNGSPMAPDSDTRVDSEYLNDIARTLVNLETALGANPQNAPTHPSLVARLVAIEARLDALEGP